MAESPPDPAKVLATAIDKRLGGLDKTQDRLRVHVALSEHMYEISDDPSGSDPADYLSPEDAALCKEFTNLADKAKPAWPNAIPLPMQTLLGPLGALGLHAWRKPSKSVKAWPTKTLFFRTEGDVHKGYYIGRLGIGQRVPVALCDDGLLRAERSRGPAKSKAIGWGALPRPEILRPALAVGEPWGVTYKNAASKTLAEILVERSGLKTPPRTAARH